MNIKSKLLSILLILLLAFVMVSAGNHMAQAQQGSLYELTGSVGAGGMNSAGVYQTDVIIGQTAVGSSANGEYELGSGFWGGGVVTEATNLINLFLPLIQR